MARKCGICFILPLQFKFFFSRQFIRVRPLISGHYDISGVQNIKPIKS